MGIDMERKGEIVGDLDWDGLHRPRIYYAMVATFSGLFLAVLDGTICNVALPSISEDLQVSSSHLDYQCLSVGHHDVAFALFFFGRTFRV